jgi:hypothetical protein
MTTKALAIVLLSIVPTSGFSFSSMTLAANNHHSVERSPTSMFYHPTAFDRAVECVTNYGLCDLDELVELSAGKFTPHLYLTNHIHIKVC